MTGRHDQAKGLCMHVDLCRGVNYNPLAVLGLEGDVTMSDLYCKAKALSTTDLDKLVRTLSVLLTSFDEEPILRQVFCPGPGDAGRG